jgi:hypothetical protein
MNAVENNNTNCYTISIRTNSFLAYGRNIINSSLGLQVIAIVLKGKNFKTRMEYHFSVCESLGQLLRRLNKVLYFLF